MKTYKIGTYKNGQQIAKEVFANENLKEVEIEFKRMFEAIDFCPEGTDNQAENSCEAWNRKRFSEDINNVAVFECDGDDSLRTNCNWKPSNIMR